MLYSFDIFDTCLVRSCGSPENIFFLLGEELLGYSKDDCLLRDFVRERSRAESAAKTNLCKEAVTINEIYDFFDTSLYSDIDKGLIVRKEISWEEKLLVPVRQMKEKVDICRAKGKIAYVSDMYLPDDMLRNVLKNFGFYQDGDALYISGSVGCTKKTGNLFRYVKEHEGIKFSEWHHYGDNFLSDVLRPISLGIKSKRIKHCYSTVERQWTRDSLFIRNKWVVNSFAGLTRSVRLNNGIVENEDFVTNIMLPAFVPFVFCLLQKAREDGVKRLYFASRDTYIHYQMAKKLSGLFPDIELRYLYISTKVLYPIGFAVGKRDEIMFLLQHLGKFVPRKLLNTIGFSDEEIKSFSETMDVDTEVTDKQASYFVDTLLSDGMKILMVNHARAKCAALERYLKQEKFISEDKVALFDVGWRGTSQKMLRKILSNEAIFYYYGVNDGILPVKQIGRYYNFLRTTDYNRFTPRFIEFYMCKTLGGSTLGYQETNGVLKPIFDDAYSSDIDQFDFNNNLSLMLEGVDCYLKMPFLVRNAIVIFDNLSIPTLQRTSQNPAIKTVKFLESRMMWDRFTEKEKIIYRMLPHKLIKVLYHSVKKSPKYSGLWIEGCMVLSLGHLGRWMLRKNIVSEMKRVVKLLKS